MLLAMPLMSVFGYLDFDHWNGWSIHAADALPILFPIDSKAESITHVSWKYLVIEQHATLCSISKNTFRRLCTIVSKPHLFSCYATLPALFLLLLLLAACQSPTGGAKQANTTSDTVQPQGPTLKHHTAPSSPTNRLNLLSSTFHQIGVGVVIDTKGLVWITEDFAN